MTTPTKGAVAGVLFPVFFDLEAVLYAIQESYPFPARGINEHPLFPILLIHETGSSLFSVGKRQGRGEMNLELKNSRNEEDKRVD
jgi:hypothetical protein